MRLRIHAPEGTEGGSRAIDIETSTSLDVVAAALRAVTHREHDSGQYRIDIDGQLYGNPRGRSQPNVRRGATAGLEKALGRAGEMTFWSDLKKRAGQRVIVEHVFRSIWEPEDHPLLVDVVGEMPPRREPRRRQEDAPPDEAGEGASGGRHRPIRRIDELARVYLLELAFVRNPRRGPIRSHRSGRRGWRERWGTAPDPHEQVMYEYAVDALESLTRTGLDYTKTGCSHFEQRPCLIEQIGRERIEWCDRPDCPGCRGNHRHSQLFAKSEAWATTRENKRPEPLKSGHDILTLHHKPEGRVSRPPGACGRHESIGEGHRESWSRAPGRKVLVLGNHDIDPVKEIGAFDVDRTAVTLYAHRKRNTAGNSLARCFHRGTEHLHAREAAGGPPRCAA